MKRGLEETERFVAALCGSTQFFRAESRKYTYYYCGLQGVVMKQLKVLQIVPFLMFMDFPTVLQTFRHLVLLLCHC